MDNLRNKNYRCFDDTGTVDIKPITVLVGANSSGKSSFLKFFGLIKQSVSEFVRGFFLWSGPLIDFKDFENVVKDDEKSIEVDFNIKELPIYTDFKLFKTKVQDVHIHLEIGKVQIPFDMRSVIPAICGHSFFKYFYGCKVSVSVFTYCHKKN